MKNPKKKALFFFVPIPRMVGIPDVPNWVIWLIAFSISGFALMLMCAVFSVLVQAQ